MHNSPAAFVLIPSRYHASRLPGKALLRIGDQTVIQKVYQQASLSKYSTQVITDHPKIAESILSIQGNVQLRKQQANNGTERIFNYLLENDQNIQPDSVIVNVQGDEPLLNPLNIQKLVECFEDAEVSVASLYEEVIPREHYALPHRVKVEVTNGFATTFERIVEENELEWHKHIGIYAFRWKTLKALMKLPPSPREIDLSLEQLRWLDHGYSIRMIKGYSNGVSIDTSSDILEARNYLNS